MVHSRRKRMAGLISEVPMIQIGKMSVQILGLAEGTFPGVFMYFPTA